MRRLASQSRIAHRTAILPVVVVGLFLWGALGGTRLAEAGCDDFYLQHGRFAGGRTWGQLHESLSSAGGMTKDGANGAEGAPAPLRQGECRGPGCSQRGLPTPAPRELKSSPTRETLPLKASSAAKSASSFFIAPEIQLVLNRHTGEILRPPR